jgi:hypothetical protein
VLGKKTGASGAITHCPDLSVDQGCWKKYKSWEICKLSLIILKLYESFQFSQIMIIVWVLLEQCTWMGLTMLAERRHQADMVQTYTIVTGKDTVNSETWFTPVTE